jgi:CBS domain-containing protein
MAIFPVSKGSDILAWRDTIELMSGVKRHLAKKMAYLVDGEDLELLRGLEGRLEEEMAVEAGFEAAIVQALAKLEGAGSEEEITSSYRHGMELAAEYATRRGSVLVVQSLCTALHDRLVGRVLALAEEWMVKSGFGAPRVSYGWFAFGAVGREEGGVFGDYDALLVHGETDTDGAAYLAGFSRRVVAMLENCRVKSVSGITPAHPSWRGSIRDWRNRLVVGGAGEKTREELAFLVRFADARLICGDADICGEMRTLIGGLLDFYRRSFDEVARGTAEMPTGLDFFGRLRVAKTGPHRGEFNLLQYVLMPLIENVRVLAVRAGVTPTSTIDRIKGLLNKGELGVDLSQRLLRAYHDYVSLRLLQETRDDGGGDEAFLRPEELTESDLETLKGGLETLVTLQRIVYQGCGEPG